MDLFIPHLPTTINELVHLIGEVETFESKRRVDNTLNIVIEQTGKQVGVVTMHFASTADLKLQDFTFCADHYRATAPVM